jgi:hypothetical protein
VFEKTFMFGRGGVTTGADAAGWLMPPSRYPSDLTDAQGELIEPLLPGPNTGGRPQTHPRREIANAILYVVRSGCPWRYLPTDPPPWQTVSRAQTPSDVTAGATTPAKVNDRKRFIITDTTGLLIPAAN